MAQLYFYVPDTLAEKVQQRAQSAGLPLSRYLAKLVEQNLNEEWPEGYFEAVVGGWQGESLERPEQPMLEERETLD